MTRLEVRTLELDLPALVAAFTRRLHEAGLPVGAERAAQLARALALAPPIARRRLYYTARAVLVSDPSSVGVFDLVFAEVFGEGHAAGEAAPALPAPPSSVALPPGIARRKPESPDGAAGSLAPGPLTATARPTATSDRDADDAGQHPMPILASDDEVLRGKRFDALDPAELVALRRLMGRLALAPPPRLTRRARRDRRGPRIDLRRTLRDSHRTGGDPIRLARRRRVVARRRLVMLCDISGSMEPYARAYLQFLVCAAGSGPRAEAFAFATRLTRLTRALRSQSPDRAIQRAAAAAPDWSSGTRIADALKTFNDRHGRRGMARGAVIVIISDGWERGDPEPVGRQMSRLARLAYRIVWVNPRAAASGFAPRAGGMAAALPHVDALVSGHSLAALDEVAAAIAAPRGAVTRARVASDPAVVPQPEADSWASATPVAGSSVAMPSGYGPSRGRTTPGWSVG